MIIDNISNRNLYKQLGSRFELAFDYLENNNFLEMEAGKDSILGDEVFALINNYETQAEENCILEAHKKYIDLQFMVAGEEQFGYDSLINQVPSKSYDSENDYALYKSEKLSYINFTPNMFAIFYPTDLHMPGIISGVKESIKKIVVKILI